MIFDVKNIDPCRHFLLGIFGGSLLLSLHIVHLALQPHHLTVAENEIFFFFKDLFDDITVSVLGVFKTTRST